MRIQPHSTAAAALPAATTKSGRRPHAPAMKAAAPAAAPAAKPAAAARPAAAPAAAAPKVATEAKAAEAAANPETYAGAGSLLDAHA